MKIISFSLWGNGAMYFKGALENIKLANEIYPNWKCRFYIDSGVSQEYIRDIEDAGGEIIRVVNDKGSFYGMFWRFLAIDDSDVDVFISRDCDSRLNYREKVAVDEWLDSECCLHTMHDHYAHRSVPILGGMWGLKKGCYSDMTGKIKQWGRYDCKGIDQHFLANFVWPVLRSNCMRHAGHPSADRWGDYRPFPSHPPLKFGGSYVGEIFDENNNPVLA